MIRRRHKQETRTFEELTRSEQVNSLNAQIAILSKGIRHHLRAADHDPGLRERRRASLIAQLQRLIDRL